MLHLGFKNFVSKNKIVAIVSTDSSPARRLIVTAQDEGNYIDATEGRSRKSLVVTETHLIVSSVEPGTLSKRFEGVV